MYEDLLVLAEENGLYVVEKRFKSNAKGLCKNNKIALNNKLKTQAEKACVLVEELGHCFTTYGDIIEQDDITSIKQELKAREWGFKKLITFDALFSAYKQGVHNKFELAEYLNVTEEFLNEAIEHFKLKHGLLYQGEGYIICFDPFGIIIDINCIKP